MFLSRDKKSWWSLRNLKLWTNVSKAVSNLRILDMLLTKHYVTNTITYWTIKCAKGHMVMWKISKSYTSWVKRLEEIFVLIRATVRTEGQMSFEKDFVYARMLKIKIENVKWINRSSQYLLIHEGNVTNLSSSLSLSISLKNVVPSVQDTFQLTAFIIFALISFSTFIIVVFFDFYRARLVLNT